MRQLFDIYKILSTKKRILFIAVLPILIFAAIIEPVLYFFKDVGEWLIEVITSTWKDVLGGLLLVAVFVLFIFGYIHFDQSIFEFNGTTRQEAERYVYSNCHKMANNFIVAEDGRVEGFVRADKKNIDKILDVLDEYEFEDEKKLRNWLNDFLEGNHSDAVAFHNYCWIELDGEIGWAISLREEYR